MSVRVGLLRSSWWKSLSDVGRPSQIRQDELEFSIWQFLKRSAVDADELV